MKKLENRRTELDFLRLAAILAVIATHLCGGPVKALDTASGIFAQLTSLRAAVTWDVPAFVMISGCLFLAPEKEVSIGKIFKKCIWHLAVCFAVWSAVFQVYYYVISDTHLNLNGIISEFLMGPYPFWYLFMLAGLYMIIPFLRSFAQDRKLVRYFLILFLAGEFLVNYGVRLPGIGPTLDQILGKSNFHFALGFTGYYLLGHYLSGSRISLKKERLLYAAGIGCVIFTCAATTWQSRVQGVYTEWFSKYLMPNVIVESAALFVFFTKRVSRIQFSQHTRAILKNLSGLGFGVYLVHALVIEVFNHMGITVLRFAPLPAECLPTFSSHAIEMNIHRIPGLAEHFVYFNDDMFLARPAEETDFFRDGLPCTYGGEYPIELVGKIGIWQHAAVNNLGVVNAHFDKRAQVVQFGKKYANSAYRWQDNIRTKVAEKLFPNYFTGFRNLHAPGAYRKQTFEEVWAAEPELMNSTTAHRFRSADDVNQWVCLWWQVASGQFSTYNTDNVVMGANDDTIDELCSLIRAQSHDMLCINDPDGEVDVEKLAARLKEAFEAILPEKSAFEK